MKHSDSLRKAPTLMWIMFTVILVNRLGTMGLPFLVLFLVEGRSFTAANAGLMLSLYGASAVLIAPIAGRLCDHIPPTKIMQVTMIASGTCAALLPTFGSELGVGLCVICWALFSEAFRPANYILVMSLAPAGQEKRFLAISRLAVNIGMSVGPALGGALLTWSYEILFIVDGLTSIAAGGILICCSRRFAKVPLNRSPSTLRVPTDGRTAPPILLLGIVLLILLPAQLVFFEQQSVLPLYLTGPLDFPPFVYGLAFTLNTILIVIFEVPLNTRLGHMSNNVVCAWGALLVGLGFGSMAFVSVPLGLIAPVVVWSFGEMLFLSSSAAYVAELAPKHKRGTFMGLYQMGLSSAFALSSIIGVGVATRWGYPYIWALSFGATLMSAIGLLLLRRKPTTANRCDTI